MSSQEIDIVFMKSEYLDSVVAVHMKSFPGFFLTFLGPSFLRLLYGEMLKSSESVMIAAVERHSQQVVGFAVGVENQSRFYSHLLRKRLLGFAWASLSGVLRKPAILPRLARAAFYPRRTEAALTPACFMSMGVNTNAAGGGIGKKVANAFLLNMKLRGIQEISLTTDRDNNDRTNRFHQNTGFKLIRDYITPEGRVMNEYYLDLSEWTPPADIFSSLPLEER